MTTDYTRTFQNQEIEEITMIEDCFALLSDHHCNYPIRARPKATTYWHESCTVAARLNRNLRLMAEHMEIEVRLGMVQGRFEMDKIRVPKTR